MRRFGLIGKTLKHSFSGKYFNEKYKKEQISDCQYDLFELPTIEEFPKLVANLRPQLAGFNVTIPYKKEVMTYLDELDPIAERIGAVNVIKAEDNGNLKGYNSDYFGFRLSIEPWLTNKNLKALVLGTGGASSSVKTTLEDLGIDFSFVSRKPLSNGFTYDEIKSKPEILAEHQLVINSSPVGTFPDVDQKPDLPYGQLTSQHFLFDLVYNPEETAFLKEGKLAGASTKNGGDMLVLQAEKSWEIWNS